MKKLCEIIERLELLEVIGNTENKVSGIAFDSRKVEANSLFVATRGTVVDGHQFIPAAIGKGACAIVCEEMPSNLDPKVTYLRVQDSNVALGLMASSFYGHPSEKLKVVGVTGTNGKTSIATLLHKLTQKLGYKAGLISTIKYIAGAKELVASHTTPDALTIQSLFAQMVYEGCEYCFMEVSSHAIHQNRIAGIKFESGVFTNLTHDHLDYHKTFAEYIKAKKKFFDKLLPSAFAIINADDRNGSVMVQNSKAKVFTYSLRAVADYKCKILENHLDGMLVNMDGDEVWTKFVGKFNASNLLAVYSTMVCLGFEKQEVLTGISELTPVQGRFETIRSLDGKLAIVDYAHTPDALKNVLQSITELRTRNEQVITVVGAGGDRDKSKRPEMAKEALAASDKVILTSDNPRTEDPAQIIADMETGITASNRNKVLSIVNRREAIKTAVMLAIPGDIILVAGKGHENYQEINGLKHHFDDKEILEELFELTKE